MSTFAFILGTNPLLSISELWHRYGKKDFEFLHADFAVLSLKNKMDQSDFNQLGGSIKMAEVLKVVSKNGVLDGLVEVLNSFYLGSKLDYGVSVYGFSEKQLRPILLKLKRQLRSNEIKSRFINHQFKNISAAQYKSIRKKGVELVVLKKGGEFLIGKVVGVQDIDAYSKRDFDKPFRDMKMGMMPPKMAQILLNITEADLVWDPFCGSGTLLMEGLLMDKQVFGSDINSRHVAGSKQNVEWLIKNFQITAANFEIFQHDATTRLQSLDLNLNGGAIAFEGDLGLPHNQNINLDLLNKIIVQLTQLYVQFFQQLKDSNFKGSIVAALPYFKLKTGEDLMMSRLIDQLKKMGLKRDRLLPMSAQSEDLYILKYSRSGQAVGRGIYKFLI